MRFAALIFFLLFLQNLFCQDTIRFKNGDIKAVKVEEVGLNQISYSRSDIADGPLYTINKSDVISIKYKNGQIDTFDGAASTSNTTPSYSQPTSPSYIPKETLMILGNRLYYKDQAIRIKLCCN